MIVCIPPLDELADELALLADELALLADEPALLADEPALLEDIEVPELDVLLVLEELFDDAPPTPPMPPAFPVSIPPAPDVGEPCPSLGS